MPALAFLVYLVLQQAPCQALDRVFVASASFVVESHAPRDPRSREQGVDAINSKKFCWVGLIFLRALPHAARSPDNMGGRQGVRAMWKEAVLEDLE